MVLKQKPNRDGRVFFKNSTDVRKKFYNMLMYPKQGKRREAEE